MEHWSLEKVEDLLSEEENKRRQLSRSALFLLFLETIFLFAYLFKGFEPALMIAFVTGMIFSYYLFRIAKSVSKLGSLQQKWVVLAETKKGDLSDKSLDENESESV